MSITVPNFIKSVKRLLRSSF